MARSTSSHWSCSAKVGVLLNSGSAKDQGNQIVKIVGKYLWRSSIFSNPESPFFSTIYLITSSKKQKIIHHHLKFFLIHFVVLASENFMRLHNDPTMSTSAGTIILNTLIAVIVILGICCNRYFKFSENQALEINPVIAICFWRQKEGHLKVSGGR